MTNHEIDPNSDPHDLVTGYLLDVLDDQELSRFTAHLDDCAYCQSAIAELSGTLAALASSSQVVPPQQVEDRLMASLFGETHAVQSPVVASEPEHVHDVEQSAPIQLHSRRRWMWPAAAAATFVLAAALVTTMGIGQSKDDGQLLADAQTQLVLNVAAAPDAHTMALNLLNGDATVVVSAGMNQAAVMASDLPAPPRGKKYHVWTLRSDGSVASAGSFTPDADGNAAVMLHSELADATGFAVTVDDPALLQPTSAPIAAVNL